MSHPEKIAELVHECWTRGKAHMWAKLGREPKPWELANHVLSAQMFTMAMFLLSNDEQVAWLKESIVVAQDGLPPGVA